MLRLPARFAAVILCFAPLFRQHTWQHAQVLLIGAILVPGQRTVTRILRISGLCRERRFVNYHRVLNRAAWSGRVAARVLLGLLLDAFVPHGPVLLGLDDTIERRRGKRISAKGIYRDPVRSSRSHFVKASGLRWLSLMLLVPISWAGRVWALPFLTTLAPSERYCREHGRRHKKLTDWGRQLVLQARRWMPGRSLVLVADSSFAALELLASLVQHGVTCVTRLRLDAALYTPAPPRQPKTLGRPRTKGERLPTLAKVLADQTTAWQRVVVPDWYGEGERVVEICSDTAVWRHSGMPVVPIRWVLLRDPGRRFDPQALLCTDLAQEPLQIVRWFAQRWQLEVTFREVRDHLGVETQRQWSDKAIARTTPCLLGLFSIVTLLATRLSCHANLQVSAAAWYRKQRPTFADTLAAVRQQLWREQGFLTSRHASKPAKLRPALRDGIVHALCYAA
ncbi:IS701 family transposase [Belnapia rosea]|uniref:IS701 family transposase n=1 Tax=Belnapia rosea TaxID=938405 RepID=UPI00088E226A|nr:transposase [Belnapia rosea]SDB74411.1 DDE superfamily endonuclease [Belnapia rosea]